MTFSKPFSTPERTRLNWSDGFKNLNRYSNESSFKRVVKLIFFATDLLLWAQLQSKINEFQWTAKHQTVDNILSRAVVTCFHQKRRDKTESCCQQLVASSQTKYTVTDVDYPTSSTPAGTKVLRFQLDLFFANSFRVNSPPMYSMGKYILSQNYYFCLICKGHLVENFQMI